MWHMVKIASGRSKLSRTLTTNAEKGNEGLNIPNLWTCGVQPQS